MPLSEELLNKLTGAGTRYPAQNIVPYDALPVAQSLGLGMADSYNGVTGAMRTTSSLGQASLLRDLAQSPYSNVITDEASQIAANRLRARLSAINAYLARNPHAR